MLRIARCTTFVSLLLIPLLASSAARLTTAYPHFFYPCSADTGKTQPMGFYYNLRGERIYLPGDTISRTMLVLTQSREPSIIMEKVSQHMVLDIPTQEVIDSMVMAFNRSDTFRHEFLFLVGKRGQVSMMVEGSDTAVETRPARIDLDQVKSDEPAYTVHVHENYPESGVTGDYRPSGIDRESKNFRDRLQASVILGYSNDHSWQMITFYYLDNIENISFRAFYKLVKKIAAEKHY